MRKVSLIPVESLPLVKAGDDISELIVKSCKSDGITIEENDIIVVAQKIVSKAENAVLSLSDVTPSKEAIELANQTGRDPRIVQVYLDEASEILFVKGSMIITKHKLGFKMSSSGVDTSNMADWEKKKVVLIPKDPDKSCSILREGIKKQTGKTVAVIMNDSLGRDERDGSIGMAIGIAGISHLELRKQKDLFGNRANSRIALIDELAASASMLMGQANESIPVVIIRGIPFTVDKQASIKNILN
jgi:coenzyme F420-0:L-glutamate ligase/coenzyme F420-1:gamma-L-glutamate ligase